MATRLFVGSLGFNVTEDQLKELFAGAGTVASATIINDRDTGQSKGFGFVEMSTDEEAQTAIKELNLAGLSPSDGRALTVNEARPREERGPRPSGDRRY